MRKKEAYKSVLCLGAAAFLVVGMNQVKISATGISAEASLAGISLSLEQYMEAADLIKDVADLEDPEKKNEEEKEDGQAAVPAGASEAEVQGTAAAQVNKDEVPVVVDIPEEEKTEPEEPPVSKYENMGISIANDYVNIRKKPDTESKILGKLYRGAAATIVATKGDWVKIKSGSVEGYIKSEYLAIGYDAEELEDKFGTKWATVNTTTLKVREKKSTESIVLGLIPLEETYEVLKEYKEWVKILVDEGDESEEGTVGYVHKDYVDISVEFEHAISIEEEQEELRRIEEAKKAEEERLRQLEEENRIKQQQQQQQNSSNSGSNSSNSGNSNSSNSNSGGSNSSSSNSGGSSSNSGNSGSAPDKEVASGDGEAIAAYAQKFVGNDYVYGGTSLTNGADCSGFTQSVFSHFGISIPRTSRSQAGAGRKVSFDNLKAGDLIFYTKNGTVNHVALYIGNGQVVHASTEKTGIKISTWNYRTPYTARRIVE